MTNRLFDLHRPFSLVWCPAKQSKRGYLPNEILPIRRNNSIDPSFQTESTEWHCLPKTDFNFDPVRDRILLWKFHTEFKILTYGEAKGRFLGQAAIFHLAMRPLSVGIYLLYLRTTRINQNSPCTSIRLTASESNKTTEMCSIFQLNWICTSLALWLPNSKSEAEHLKGFPLVGGSIHHSSTHGS